ncbi:sulfur carrier protein ThiS [Amphritea sp.]|uniref:sulfur carrier protein ThiS n=1 Tax=Amphritea sp. TaxID=1872502 RepID=UPI003D0FCF80
MLIQVNGDSLELQEGTSVAGLIEKMELGERRVAVELNLEIVPRSRHAETLLQEGDRVEVVHAIGGG